MSQGERKLYDERGKFMQAVKDGHEIRDADWNACRVVLTTERVVLIGDEKRSIDIDTLGRVNDRFDVNQSAAVEGSYTSLRTDDMVFLVSTPDQDTFETALYKASLNNGILLVQHPAVEGGVVQDVEWTKAKTKISEDAIRFAMADGQKVRIDRDDIGDVETDKRTVDGQDRTVYEVEHTEDDRSVETHLTGESHHTAVMGALLEEGVERHRANLDLDGVEKQVIMALHSGVSPFDIPEFVDQDVERVEEIFDRLIEYDVIEVERERTEVALTPEGRQAAGESIGDR
ncbi:Component of chemotaxis system associated with archaellum, contains CheF-like and HTH domain [Halapricum desulfuricans]|uniref:Taxis protein CheF n=1 Tax=Halapricum desulfuricans TaxID=2841257 RepID=A0A897NN41_9EURY|nr:CheF family chemotaxis protein [Halapricum desulfuricans]QSG12269.1 Component of chemotaxis system associated with archaellum, contains CheF-like and HTH domain [Halapricum desulfuricans]